MGISAYLQGLRAKVGNDLIVVPAAVAMLFDKFGRLLTARDAGTGLWMAVGGAIDPDETPAEAAARECREETGLVVEPVRLMGVFGGRDFRSTYPNGDKVSFVMIAFEVRLLGGRLQPDDSEVTELRFVTAAEAAELAMSPLNRILFERAFERQTDSFFDRRLPSADFGHQPRQRRSTPSGAAPAATRPAPT